MLQPEENAALTASNFLHDIRINEINTIATAVVFLLIKPLNPFTMLYTSPVSLADRPHTIIKSARDGYSKKSE